MWHAPRALSGVAAKAAATMARSGAFEPRRLAAAMADTTDTVQAKRANHGNVSANLGFFSLAARPTRGLSLSIVHQRLAELLRIIRTHNAT